MHLREKVAVCKMIDATRKFKVMATRAEIVVLRRVRRLRQTSMKNMLVVSGYVLEQFFVSMRAQRWSKLGDLTVFRGHLNFDHGDICRVYEWCRLWCRRGTGREYGAVRCCSVAAPPCTCHLSKQAGLLSSRPVRTEGRSTLIAKPLKTPVRSNKKSDEYYT